MLSEENYSRKELFLSELNRKDGDDNFSKQKFPKALRAYSEALRHVSDDVKCLVGRSKCYTKLRRLRKAMDDVDLALHIDSMNKDIMSQQMVAADLLRRAANALTATVSDTSTLPSFTPVTSSVANEVKRLFAPYNRGPGTFTSKGRRPTQHTGGQFWSHRFCVLASTTQDTIPNRIGKKELFDAGLGEKKVILKKDNDPNTLKSKLEEVFPKLKEGGGFELLRSNVGSRLLLERIKMPKQGYTTNFLADESNLFQALCYVRPIQRDLSIEVVSPENDICEQDQGPWEQCINCGDQIKLMCLRQHLKECTQEDEEDDLPPPVKVRKCTYQLPVCKYTCGIERKQDDISQQNNQASNIPCPVCGVCFPKDSLEFHASSCGEDSSVQMDQDSGLRTLEEEMESIYKKIATCSESWTVRIVRRLFLQTALEELFEAVDEDWCRPMKVTFIGEDGVDAGGLGREFFTILFNKAKTFQSGTFHLDAELLLNKDYLIMGRATAVALINGHPGPRCFNKLIAEYITSGEEPDFDRLIDECVQRADVAAAVHEIETANAEDLSTLVAQYSELLGSTGFNKVLSDSTRKEAITALKTHYSFYHVMGPLLQYMEGLKLHGVLGVIQSQQHRQKSVKLFCIGKFPTSNEVQEFFLPSFSTEKEKKELEEVIVYHFNKFLKKAERGTISTPWISVDETVMEQNVVINMGHVLQALVGSPNIPRNLESGVIEFDHNSNNLPSTNTCAPSITFSKTTELQDYNKFEMYFMFIVVGAPGFGKA